MSVWGQLRYRPVCGDLNLSETLGYCLVKVGMQLWLGRRTSSASMESRDYRITASNKRRDI